MVFYSKRLDASTAELRAWYIDHHAPDFLSFARPHLARYAQNFVERARAGDVDFDCILEFVYRSHEDQAAVLGIVQTPEGREALTRHPRPGSQPGPNEAHDGPRRFGTEQRLVSGPARGYDHPATPKVAALLRRKDAVSVDAFRQAVASFAATAARKADRGAARVVLTLALPNPLQPVPLYDAVIQLWPKDGAEPTHAFDEPPDTIEVAAIVDLVSYEADLGTA